QDDRNFQAIFDALLPGLHSIGAFNSTLYGPAVEGRENLLLDGLDGPLGDLRPIVVGQGNLNDSFLGIPCPLPLGFRLPPVPGLRNRGIALLRGLRPSCRWYHI